MLNPCSIDQALGIHEGRRGAERIGLFAGGPTFPTVGSSFTLLCHRSDTQSCLCRKFPVPQMLYCVYCADYSDIRISLHNRMRDDPSGSREAT